MIGVHRPRPGWGSTTCRNDVYDCGPSQVTVDGFSPDAFQGEKSARMNRVRGRKCCRIALIN